MIRKILPRLFFVVTIIAFAMVSFVFSGDLEMRKNNMNWIFYSDQVMGGKSQGRAEVVLEGNKQFVRLQGNVTTVNNGGFIQIRKPIAGLSKDLKGISLKIRGNGERYFVFIRTSGTMLPWQYYKADFPSTREWAEVHLEFKSFMRSSAWLGKRFLPEKIKSVGVVAFGRDHEALIDVASLKFF